MTSIYCHAASTTTQKPTLKTISGLTSQYLTLILCNITKLPNFRLNPSKTLQTVVLTFRIYSTLAGAISSHGVD